MSLLDAGALYEACNIYPEVVVTSRDGNTQVKASTTPIAATARFQIQGQSGTSARRAETDSEGETTEQVYKMRLPRSWTAAHGILGAASQVGWGIDSMGREKIWNVFGDVAKYNGSRRTQHVSYTLRRA